MLKRKETFGDEYEKAIEPSTVQFMLSTFNKKPYAAPRRHQKYEMYVSETYEKFCILDKDDVVYVDANASESSTNVIEPSQK